MTKGQNLGQIQSKFNSTLETVHGSHFIAVTQKYKKVGHCQNLSQLMLSEANLFTTSFFSNEVH